MKRPVVSCIRHVAGSRGVLGVVLWARRPLSSILSAFPRPRLDFTMIDDQCPRGAADADAVFVTELTIPYTTAFNRAYI